MEELKVSPEELKKLIDIGKVLGKGFFGYVFEYKDKLIKLDDRLYKLLRNNSLADAEWAVHHRYKFDQDDFNDRSQLEYLFSVQPNVTLTKLPEGIVTLSDVDPKYMGISPGIIIPYHKNHEKLETLSPLEYKKVLIILKKLLESVRELADHKISQEDFVQYDRFNRQKRNYNVLYQGDTPQIIDMSGVEIMAGSDFVDAKNMYKGLGNIVFDYFDFNDLKSPYLKDEADSDQKIVEMIDEFEKQTKNK